MDRRDRALIEGKWYERFDERSMLATILVYDEEGLETEVFVPCVYETCGTCQGRGSHVNPSIDAHGITGEEWERDWSPDEREDYLAGAYDVSCHECGGLRVVPVPDEGRLTDEMRKAIEAGRDRQRESYEDARTRRMESGDWGC